MRLSIVALVLAAGLLLLTALCPNLRAEALASAATYQVVVNPSNRMATIERKFLEDAFLKKIRSWPDGGTIHPVDLAAGSPVRRRFSEEVLNRSVEAVKGFWQQRVFSGRDVPPPELETDADVVKYVLKHEGAVGYVSGAAALDGSRVVGVR
jgi:ABC-type phosphate transport system substrate-binding protein